MAPPATASSTIERTIGALFRVASFELVNDRGHLVRLGAVHHAITSPLLRRLRSDARPGHERYARAGYAGDGAARQRGTIGRGRWFDLPWRTRQRNVLKDAQES